MRIGLSPSHFLAQVQQQQPPPLQQTIAALPTTDPSDKLALSSPTSRSPSSDDIPTMTDTSPAHHLLVTVTGGMVLEQRSNGSYSTTHTGSSTAQKWTLEKSPSDDKTFAFRNVGNGQYLRAVAGGRNASVRTGPRQWWVLEKGSTPGTFWIKCKDYQNAYLCNSWGSFKPNNLVYIWTPDRAWTHSMLWYITDTKVGLPDPAGLGSSSGSGAGGAEVEREKAELAKQKTDLEAKEKALADRERQVSESEEKSKDVEQQRDELEAREKVLEERESKQKAELEQKEKDLAAQEAKSKAALEEREKALSGKGNKLKQSSPSSPSSSQKSPANDQQQQKTTEDLQARETALAKREEDLEQRSRAIEEKEKRQQQNQQRQDQPSNDFSSSNDPSIAPTKSSSEEIARLRNQIQDLEAQIARNSSVTSQPRKRGTTPPIAMPRGFSSLPRLQSSRGPLREW